VADWPGRRAVKVLFLNPRGMSRFGNGFYDGGADGVRFPRFDDSCIAGDTATVAGDDREVFSRRDGKRAGGGGVRMFWQEYFVAEN